MAPSHDDSSNLTAARSLEDRVWRSLRDKDARKALAVCEQLNREHPGYASGWHTASQLALRLNNPVAALAAIDKALAIEPGNTDGLLQRALCTGKLGDTAALEPMVEELANRDLSTAYRHATLGMLYTQLERREEAVACYERAAALEPDRAKHYYNIAALQRSLGDIEQAETNFDRAIELDPADWEAIKVRSELRKQTPDDNHVETLQALLDKGIADPRGEVHVCYALAKELEDLGEWERSFGYLKRGADKRRSLMRYDVQRDIDTMAAIRETFTAELLAGSHAGSGNKEPIFIVGMPRTGTTLVERVLGSHSEVYSAGELGNFATVLMQQVRARVEGPPPPRDELVRLSASIDFAALGDAYVESTRPFTGGTPRFIDKLPLNFLYVGLIRLALPGAKIISVRRHPLDTCYAVYKQLFVEQAAVRRRLPVLLRPRGTRALLRGLRPAHAALEPRAAGRRLHDRLRDTGRRLRTRGAPLARALRAGLRGTLPALPREQDGLDHRQHRAGPATRLPQLGRQVAPVPDATGAADFGARGRRDCARRLACARRCSLRSSLLSLRARGTGHHRNGRCRPRFCSAPIR
jgi:tetratricopeptide (TPR) repeat protein